MLLVVGKCSLCSETAEEDTTWGDEICLSTKGIHLIFLWSTVVAKFHFLLFISFFYDCSCLCKFISYCFMYQLLSDAESVRWLNYAINKMWPVCMEKIVSQLLRPIIPWFLDKFKPWTVVWFPSFILIFWFIFSILWHFTSNCFFNNVFLWQSHFSFVK